MLIYVKLKAKTWNDLLTGTAPVMNDKAVFPGFPFCCVCLCVSVWECTFCMCAGGRGVRDITIHLTGGYSCHSLHIWHCLHEEVTWEKSSSLPSATYTHSSVTYLHNSNDLSVGRLSRPRSFTLPPSKHPSLPPSLPPLCLSLNKAEQADTSLKMRITPLQLQG